MTGAFVTPDREGLHMSRMPVWAARHFTLLAIAFGGQSICVHAQSAPKTPTFQVNSSLTLVDVIAEKSTAGLRGRALLTGLKRDDFRVFDDGHLMPIESFDAGASGATRPLALWLIVQCHQSFHNSWREAPGYHSMFIKGKTQYLLPALSHLGRNDAVGAAHWCDNGEARIDLKLGRDQSAALTEVEVILQRKPIVGNDRIGELAMQRMIRMILKSTQETEPARLPVLLFLYGDECATYREEANNVLDDLLRTTGIVFGLNDGSFAYVPRSKIPQIAEELDPGMRPVYYLVHYYSLTTGGEVYSTADPKLYANVLDYILTQLHFRYTIGFVPKKVDGKRHTLRVELTKAANREFPDTVLRYRTEYIPVEHK